MKFKDLLAIVAKNKLLLVILIIVGIFVYFQYTQSVIDTYYIDGESNGLVEVPAVGDIPDRTVLEQGEAWDQELRERYWFTSQGSAIIPYTWFVWLEQAKSESLFRSADFIEKMGYLRSESSALNPGGLPIGFATQRARKDEQPWMGFNCAACHTNQINYKGSKMMIEGAPTLANFEMIYTELINALIVTTTDNEKFKRFASNVIGSDASESAKSKLRDQMKDLIKAAQDRQKVNALPSAHFPEDFAGYARVDAFGQIANAGTAFALHDLENKNPPSAPVSYPFLWGTHQSDVVQWNASAPNIPIVGPLVRNVGEVIGVFGNLSIDKPLWWQGLLGFPASYSSTVDYQGIGDIEAWIKELQSPQWPENILPPIKREIANEGAVLFNNYCSECHEVISRDDEFKTYKANRTPLYSLGTDPMMAYNAGNGMADTKILQGTKKYLVAGDTLGRRAGATSIVVNGILGVILKRPKKALAAGKAPEKVGDDKEQLSDYLRQLIQKKKENEDAYVTPHDTTHAPNAFGPNGEVLDLHKLVYKGRPLNGIWATAPFLHNGSVPNLWELLQAPTQRVTNFSVGSREFDAENVGFVTDEGPGEFRVLRQDSTIMPGNSNLGHDYGTGLTDNQKLALIEYMKTL